MSHHPLTLRDEVAAVAARLIAEDGVDYANAKRRALAEVTGSNRAASSSDAMPDNATIEAAVRAHQAPSWPTSSRRASSACAGRPQP